MLVFDLDGTLIDSSRDLCNSVNAALVEVGRPELPHELIVSYVGDGAAMLVRRALGDPGDVDSQPGSVASGDELFHRAFEFFLSYYRLHKLDYTRAYPGVMEALEEIRARHPELPMAVLTNKPVLPSREICRALGLDRFFFQNYGGNSFASKKPDPEGLLTLIAEANAARGEVAEIVPAGVVMVGDSDVDVLTAKRCGARSLGCEFGLAVHAMKLAGPDAMVARASEWPGALGL